MSLSGPVLSIQLPVSQHTPHTLTPMATPVALDLDTSSSQLLSIPSRRERANSEGDVHAVTQGLTLSPSPLAKVSNSNLFIIGIKFVVFLCPYNHCFNLLAFSVII